MITTVIKYQDIKSAYRNHQLSYILAANNSTQNTIQKIKYLGKSLAKAVKDFYKRKFKILKKLKKTHKKTSHTQG